MWTRKKEDTYWIRVHTDFTCTLLILPSSAKSFRYVQPLSISPPWVLEEYQKNGRYKYIISKKEFNKLLLSEEMLR